MFGDESYSFKLRIAALAIIFKYESFFSIYSTLFQKPFGFFINQVAKDKAWGNDFVALALSIVINRPIAWYNVATSKEGSSLDFDLNVDHGYFNNIYYVNQKQLLIKPIQLVLKSGHFTALLPLNEDYTFKYNRTPSNQFCRLVLNYD